MFEGYSLKYPAAIEFFIAEQLEISGWGAK
jgi:hypothetical protein